MKISHEAKIVFKGLEDSGDSWIATFEYQASQRVWLTCQIPVGKQAFADEDAVRFAQSAFNGICEKAVELSQGWALDEDAVKKLRKDLPK